jgi:hypothetical protein
MPRAEPSGRPAEGGVAVRVVPHAEAAEGGTERGVVDGDEGVETGDRVRRLDDAFVALNRAGR